MTLFLLLILVIVLVAYQPTGIRIYLFLQTSLQKIIDFLQKKLSK